MPPAVVVMTKKKFIKDEEVVFAPKRPRAVADDDPNYDYESLGGGG